ncbi:MAG: endonuclease III [Deltaproteobacteria bacterium]|nr:MAG: endonuclease III [Deltaproteobacteria bacterium]
MTTPAEKFNIDDFVRTIESNYRQWNPPVITFIAHRGADPFQILVSTLLSLRTKDEVTAKAAQKLFARARTPEQIVALGKNKIQKLIYPVGFYPTKAGRLVEISEIIIEKYNGKVPGDLDALLELPGVGRKTANLVLVEGFRKPAICVDTHVHRISNRIGYVRTKTPDKTEFALRKKLPLKHWIKYNELLVAFGQVICRPVSPFCSRCPAARMCARVGVSTSR